MKKINLVIAMMVMIGNNSFCTKPEIKQNTPLTPLNPHAENNSLVINPATLNMLSPGLNILIGALTSLAEKPLYPLGFMQNKIMQDKPIFKPTDKFGNKIPILKQIARFYRGLPASMFTYCPSTGIEIAINAAITNQFSANGKLSTEQKLGAGAMAGVFSAFIDTPVETVVLRQQGTGKSLAKTLPEIYTIQPQESQKKFQGIRNFYRGLIPNIGRNALGACGYLAFFEACKDYFKEFTSNENFQSTLAAIVTGFSTATLSHPLTFIKTRLQSDVERTKYSCAWDATDKIFKKEGERAFFKGYWPRTIRYCLGAWIMNTTQNKLKLLLQENKKSNAPLQNYPPHIKPD